MSRCLLPRAFSTCRCLHSPPISKVRSSLGSNHQISPSITSWRNRIPQKKSYSTHESKRTPNSQKKFPPVAALCLVSVLISVTYQSWKWPESNDAPPENPLSHPNAKKARIEISEHGTEEIEQISTGTSTVPFFPCIIRLPRTGAVDDGKSRTLPAGIGAVRQDEEYQLIGLGIRTVSFLRIQVYVVGLYVARSDLSKLQAGMVRAIATPGATTLVEGEKDTLKQTLLEGTGSGKVWSEILKHESIKSALRIVPTRGTDFGHLRDGWVRGITARSKAPEFDNEAFKTAVGEFKKIFGGRKLGKGKALLLGRGSDGAMNAWVEEGTEEGGTPRDGQAKQENLMVPLGGVQDERVSRLVWLGYVAGDNVASEGARKSIVEGIMELAERPVGTVETRVV